MTDTPAQSAQILRRRAIAALAEHGPSFGEEGFVARSSGLARNSWRITASGNSQVAFASSIPSFIAPALAEARTSSSAIAA